jgi:hypothetical protein
MRMATKSRRKATHAGRNKGIGSLIARYGDIMVLEHLVEHFVDQSAGGVRRSMRERERILGALILIGENADSA